jgi:predicted ATP-grasp superfamily ATP-dependent carboligase
MHSGIRPIVVGMTDRASGTAVPVLILGAHITALGVLRILARRGIACYVVDDTRNVVSWSRWYRPTSPTLVESADSAALAEFLERLAIPTAVLIPCSDQWALAVAGLPDGLRHRFPASISELEAVRQFVDKDRFRDLVTRLDIPRPWTIPITCPDDLDAISDEELANGFLKPTDSQRHNRRFGTKGAFVTSREGAAGHVRAAAAAGITFMLQEWIPGSTSHTYLVDGFVDRLGTMKAISARQRVRMDPPRLANTASDVTIPIERLAAVIPSLRRMLEEVDYRGIFNIEFKLDDRDGRFKIIELNPRPFWMISHVANAGVDLPFLTYLDALGMPVPEVAASEVGRPGVYEIPDAAAILRAWAAGRRPDGRVVRPWLTGDRALFWFRDPMPGVAGVWHLVAKRIRRVGRALRLPARTTPSGRSMARSPAHLDLADARTTRAARVPSARGIEGDPSSGLGTNN